MSQVYTGPDRRIIPRDDTWDPEMDPIDKILCKLDVLKRLLTGGYMERGQTPVPPRRDGFGA